jgi:uncharacterized protein (DUF433 family)
MRALARARTLILSDPEIMGGDPVFRGTRVPVHMIAELIAQGSKPAELIESYPRITAEMIRLAPVYAAAFPLRGSKSKFARRDKEPAGRSRRKLGTIVANEKTIEAMKAARRGELTSAGSPSKLLANLNADRLLTQAACGATPMSGSPGEARRIRTPEEWLTAALLRMVLAYCARPEGALDSFGWSANAEALRLLAEGGFIRIDDEAGDRIRATVLLEAEAFLAWMTKAETR